MKTMFWEVVARCKRMLLEKRLRPAVFAVLFGCIGVTLIVFSHAATPAISVETENGTAANGTSVTNDPSASGAHGVQFGSGAAIKPAFSGLEDRQAQPAVSYQAVVHNFVVKVNWATIQPINGGVITSNNAIDQALTSVRSLNAANPGLNMRIKLRVLGGIWAPDWVKTMDGTPIDVGDPNTGASGTVGRFWLPDYGAAYDDLQTKLAAKYDSSPEVAEVSIDRCTTVYDEPMIRQTADATTRQNLLAAGYSVALDQQCQHEQVDSHKVWTTTPSSFAFNPYQVLNANGSTATDETFTESMMDYCRATLGKRCVLENNSVSSPIKPGSYQAMYDYIHTLGPPITYQTDTPANIGDWRMALSWAVGQGANVIELVYNYNPTYPLSELSAYDSQLLANPH